VKGVGRKRGLSNVGGRIETMGDAATAEVIARAFAVRAGERDATLTHPFHAYPARLHPEVARQLVAEVVRENSIATVLDPCCGSGTVLVESLVAGAQAIGTDLSPLAVELATLKTTITTSAERAAMVSAAHDTAKQAASIARSSEPLRHPRGEERWFHTHTLREVSALALTIDALPHGFVRAALRMLLSSILVKVSLQSSDSDPRRVADKPVRPGAAPHFFARKSLELEQCLAALAKATPRTAPRADAHADDATTLRTIADASVDAIITSPPYANTYDYLEHHTRRYRWLRMDPGALGEREIGASRWFDEPEAGRLRFEREMRAMIASFARTLRPGGRAFVVMADGAAGHRPLFADDLLRASIRDTPFRLLAAVSQTRPTFDAISARAFRDRPKREHLVALVRAATPDARAPVLHTPAR
jgi:DNA modification methylase